jgi:hypothetical protein
MKKTLAAGNGEGGFTLFRTLLTLVILASGASVIAFCFAVNAKQGAKLRETVNNEIEYRNNSYTAPFGKP